MGAVLGIEKNSVSLTSAKLSLAIIDTFASPLVAPVKESSFFKLELASEIETLFFCRTYRTRRQSSPFCFKLYKNTIPKIRI